MTRRPIIMLLSAACAALLLATVINSASAGTSVRREESAWAFWSFPTARPHHTIQYGAVVVRAEDQVTRKVIQFGGFFKARCVSRSTDNSTVTRCRGAASKRPTDFFIDPLLRDAWVEAGPNRVEWKMSDVPGVGGYVSEEWCWWENEEGEEEEGSGRGGGRAVDAEARGRMFDRRLEPSGEHFSLLLQGAMISDCPFGFSEAEVDDFMDGGRVSYSFTQPR